LVFGFQLTERKGLWLETMAKEELLGLLCDEFAFWQETLLLLDTFKSKDISPSATMIVSDEEGKKY
jgi:hypothetical protein